MMRTPGRQPRILLTNVKQLELLLTRQHDVNLFADARLDLLVFDEAHTFTGAQGAETACLIRRLRAFCGRDVNDTVCVATSATIVDRENPEAAREFASRFFGVAKDKVTVVYEDYEPDLWAAKRKTSPGPAARCLELRERAGGDRQRGQRSQLVLLKATERDVPVFAPEQALDISRAKHSFLLGNEALFQIADALMRPVLDGGSGRGYGPKGWDGRCRKKKCSSGPPWERRPSAKAGAAASGGSRICTRRTGGVVTFPVKATSARLALSAEEVGPNEQGLFRLPLMTCTTCGQHHFVHHVPLTSRLRTGHGAAVRRSRIESFGDHSKNS